MAAQNTDLKKRQRADYPFMLDYRTRWADNDMYQHMNNAIYIILYDSTLSAYLTENCGLNPATSPQYGVVVHSHSDYFAQIAYPAVAEVGLRVNKIGRSSVVWEMGLFERGFDDVRAVGEFVQVWVDRATKKPVKDGLTEVLRRGLEKVYKGPGTEVGKSKL
ncbi:hypothetical protein CFIMG_006328RA [Ceratocystis fimbriata CBS 114723]|uniref:Uncharacterized protein n=1 Tax=Ceratocystis fimbriata CBS 114723 TaxID=1035309 RepID=A0A2C5WFT6_9PEZI|nr:hypothetical protein CFIMG_006328RA [Ceratocystis fimbriata CBS 114723]